MLAKVKLAKQTKTSLGPGVAAQRAENEARGKGEEEGRQCQSYGKTSTRLVRTGEAFNCTSADRIGSERSRSWSQSQTIARLGRQAGQLRGEGSGVSAWPSRCWTLSAYKLRVAVLPLLRRCCRCCCTCSSSAVRSLFISKREFN